MIKLAPLPLQAPSARLRSGRSLGVLAIIGAVLLWLWVLPVLVLHDGFTLHSSAVLRSHDGCLQSVYRDPVTGRPRAAPETHVAAGAACPAAALRARP